MRRILLVEDDQLIGTMVQLNLEQEGYEVSWQPDAESALEVLENDRFDALLLDITLPGLSGVELARRIRAAQIGTPIIMLTARDDTGTKINALDGGADDYVCKPFDIAELLARVRAQIRRSQGNTEIASDGEVMIGGARLQIQRRILVAVDGSSVELTAKEIEILFLLIRQPNQVHRRADILDEVWGMDAVPTERTVDNFIVRLRRWIEKTPERPRHILTIRGQGYLYDPQGGANDRGQGDAS